MNGFMDCHSDGDAPEPQGCGIGAFAVLRVPQDGFPALRKRPGPDVAKPITPGLLRQSDEQAVAAAAAVCHAIHDFHLQDLSFDHWGVVGAPCLLGRTSAASVLDKYSRLGPRGVSPLVSPYLSLHAVSAMISVALKSHGPNLGVGGGPGAVGEGLLTGLTLMLEPSTPGVWVAMTAWDPEPTERDADAGSAICHAVALALMPGAGDEMALRLRFAPGASTAKVTPRGVMSLADFLQEAASAVDGARRWHCPINGGTVELSIGAGATTQQFQMAGGRNERKGRRLDYRRWGRHSRGQYVRHGGRQPVGRQVRRPPPHPI